MLLYFYLLKKSGQSFDYDPSVLYDWDIMSTSVDLFNQINEIIHPQLDRFTTLVVRGMSTLNQKKINSKLLLLLTLIDR